MIPIVITEIQKCHLSTQDAVLAQLVAYTSPIERMIDDNYFRALVCNIVYQQISFAAGNSIWKRFMEHFVNMTPESIAAASQDALKSCGLSTPKATYVHAIADAYLTGHLTNDFLKHGTTEDILKNLVQIKGIGQWTAEMFLMFSLGHEDVFSYKDLGLRNGIQWLYGLTNPPSESFVNQLSRIWKPYNTVAAFYLWEITLQGLFKQNREDVLGSLPYFVENPGIGMLTTPIGPLTIRANQNVITQIDFSATTEIPNETPLILWAKQELSDYFDGTLQNFTVPLANSGTPFQQSVYKALRSIPYGVTQSYGQLAAAIGNSKASRAVGGANNKNALPIIIPCHRVIGANGSLTGYEGGLTIKEWLLSHEAQQSAKSPLNHPF